MKKLTLLAFALVMLIVVLGVALVRGFIYRTRGVQVKVDVAKVEKDVREHLPIGTSRADVESFLNERRIQHSFVERSWPGPEPSPKELALIPDSSSSWLTRGSIQLVFDFDNHDKLVRYSVKEIFTGP